MRSRRIVVVVFHSAWCGLCMVWALEGKPFPSQVDIKGGVAL